MFKFIILALITVYTSNSLAHDAPIPDVPIYEVNNMEQYIKTLEKMAGNNISYDDKNVILVVDGVEKDKEYINSLTMADIKSVNVNTGEIIEFQISTN